MSYVVSSKKVYRSFDTAVEAAEFYEKTYQASIYEQDMFGNLNKLADEQVKALVINEKSMEQKNIMQKQGMQDEKKPNLLYKVALDLAGANSAPASPKALNPADDAKLKLNNGKDILEKKPYIKYIIIFWLCVIIIGFVLFIVWPLFTDMWNTMVNAAIP